MSVAVVIPIHRVDLKTEEWMTVQHNVELLSGVDIIAVVPERLDITTLPTCLNRAKLQRIPNRWMTEGSLRGYNEMMLSAEFYQLFINYTYILICQPDAWLFRNELDVWCAKGYDYVGAPWWRRGIWSLPLLRYLFPKNRRLYGKVGNGGLSLRRVDSFLKTCQTQQSRIQHYLRQTHHMYGEDVFWAIEPINFRYPTMAEALQFSFDTRPQRCLETNHNQLPMGCHGWLKPQNIDFWKHYIPQKQ